MFSEIAPTYDLLNRVLSLNIDRHWRRVAIGQLGWPARPQGRFLDLCAGTLDVAAQLTREPGFAGTVVGADFAEPMLRAGRAKARREFLSTVVADALELPVADGTFDGAIVAFGIRNLEDLDAGLREVRRVLTSGANLVILECSQPRSSFVRVGFSAYFNHALPLIGRIVSRHPTAYRYLPDSVAAFPEKGALASRMERAGFANVRFQGLSAGVVAVHVGTKR